MTACTRWGLALSSDSARYVRTSRHILGTDPLVDMGIEAKGEQAHYPPFYPMALAAAGFVLRQDPQQAARWLHVAIFAGSTLLVAMLVRHGARSAIAALLAAAAFALAPVKLTTHAWLLSEALFIFLALLAVWLLARYVEPPPTAATLEAAADQRRGAGRGGDRGSEGGEGGGGGGGGGGAAGSRRWPLLIGAALATALGMLTRYAGAALGPAAVLALLLLPRERPWRRRIVDAALFSVAALVLPMLQFARNLRVGGSATNRTIAFHPISLDHLKDGIAAVATWIAPLGVNEARLSANTHPILASMAILLFALVLVAGAALVWRQRREAAGRLAAVLLLFIACFVGLLVFSISLVDFHTPMDTRVLSPVFAAWVVLAACVASRWISGLTPRWRGVAVAGAIGLAAVVAWPSRELVQRLWREGDGFAHPQWRNSATMAAVRTLPPSMQIFTNAPGAVYLLSGRQLIWTIPAEVSASSRLPNPDYPGLMARIEQEVRAGRGVVVWLNRYGRRRAYYPTSEAVRRRLGLRVRQHFDDGGIFDYAPASRTQPAVER